MCLCVGCGAHAGAHSERYAILGSLGQDFGQVDPELSVPVLSCASCRVNHDTTAVVDTYAIGDDRRLGSAAVLLRIEAAYVFVFQVAIGDEVGPTYNLCLTLLHEHHAFHGHVRPVGTLDGVEVSKALFLGHQLQVNGVNITVLREVLFTPATLWAFNQVRFFLVGVPLTFCNVAVEEETWCTFRNCHNQL